MKIFIIIIGFTAFSLQTLAQHIHKPTFVLVWVKEVTIDKDDGNLTDSFIGIFPDNNDTVNIFQLASHSNTAVSKKYSYTFKKYKKNNIVFYYQEDGIFTDSVNVLFGKEKTLFIGKDVYILNNKYFYLLKRKILNQGSILDLAFLTKDGYGDYAVILKPLYKNWRNQKDIATCRIIKATIKNKDQQAEDGKYFVNHLNYSYSYNGKLKSISGLGRYSKQFAGENKKYIRYNFTDEGNERSLLSGIIYQNKRTLLDSISAKYKQFSTGKIIAYSKCQTLIKTKIVKKKPLNFNEVIRIIKSGK